MLEELPFNVEVIQPTATRTVATARFGFATPIEETEAYRQHLREIIADFKENGKESFTPGELKQAGFTGRSDSWISQNLKKLVNEGTISYSKETKFYSIV